MQIPTMMRAPVGEPTQERRKAETPKETPTKASSNEKSFDEIVNEGEHTGNDQYTSPDETPDLTDQGMTSAQVPPKLQEMDANRHGFAGVSPLIEGDISDTSNTIDGELPLSKLPLSSGPDFGSINGLENTMDAAVSDIQKGTTSLVSDEVVPTSSAVFSDEAAPRFGAIPDGTNGDGVVSTSDTDLAKVGGGVALNGVSIKLGHEAAQTSGTEPIRADQDPGANVPLGAGMTQIGTQVGAQATADGSAKIPLTGVPIAEAEMSSRDARSHSVPTDDAIDVPIQTTAVANGLAVAATGKSIAATGDDLAQPSGDSTAISAEQDAATPTPEVSTSPPSPSDKVAPQTTLASAQVQGSFDLNSSDLSPQNKDPIEGVDFRLDGVSTTAGRETVQATALAQVQRTELPHHIAGQIAEAARQLPDRPVEITLSPEELGRVKLTFHVSENGAMSVVVQAEKAETADLMRRHIHTLQEDFASMGYEGSTFEFQQEGQGYSSENTGRGNSNGSVANEKQQAILDLEATSTTIQPHQLSLNDSARVDIRL